MVSLRILQILRTSFSLCDVRVICYKTDCVAKCYLRGTSVIRSGTVVERVALLPHQFDPELKLLPV